MDELPKQEEVKKRSTSKSQKRRTRVTVAEKLLQGKTDKKSHQSSGPILKKSTKNGDRSGQRLEKEMGTKLEERNKQNEGVGQSNPSERRKAGEYVDRTLPNKWIDYPIAINQPIGNTRFIAFKAPLGALYFDGSRFKERQKHRFEVETVIEHMNSLKLSLGMVVDLTDTHRYYDCGVWYKHKVEYVKIRCPGQQVSEGNEFYERFRKAVKQFIEQQENDDKLIGVHCTHGLNRTGYLICRYLIEELGWGAVKAIEGFHVARGYPMERAKYIEALKEIEKIKAN